MNMKENFKKPRPSKQKPKRLENNSKSNLLNEMCSTYSGMILSKKYQIKIKN